MRIVPLAVVFVLVFSGCSQKPTGSGPVTASTTTRPGTTGHEYSPDQLASWSNESGQLTIPLKDWADQGDWVLLEVAVAEEATFISRVEATFDVSPGVTNQGASTSEAQNACMVHKLGRAGGPILFVDGSEVDVSSNKAPGSPAIVRQANVVGSRVSLTNPLADEKPIVRRGIPVLFGLAEAKRWQDAGATFDLSLHARRGNDTAQENETNAPFYWRKVATGKIQCLTRFSEFPNGTFTRTPTYVEAEGLGVSYQSANRSALAVFIQADLGYSVRLVGPLGAAWQVNVPAGMMHVQSSYVNQSLPPGTWSLVVDALRGSRRPEANASTEDSWIRYVAIIDVPEWALVRGE